MLLTDIRRGRTTEDGGAGAAERSTGPSPYREWVADIARRQVRREDALGPDPSVRRHAPRRLGIVCSSRVCPFHRRERVCRRQHPQRTIAACNQAGLRVPGSGRDIQGGTRAAPSASASSAARCCCCCFCGCQTALGRHHAGEDAPVGAKPARTHPSCSATGTTRFPTF